MGSKGGGLTDSSRRWNRIRYRSATPRKSATSRRTESLGNFFRRPALTQFLEIRVLEIGERLRRGQTPSPLGTYHFNKTGRKPPPWLNRATGTLPSRFRSRQPASLKLIKINCLREYSFLSGVGMPHALL